MKNLLFARNVEKRMVFQNFVDVNLTFLKILLLDNALCASVLKLNRKLTLTEIVFIDYINLNTF